MFFRLFFTLLFICCSLCFTFISPAKSKIFKETCLNKNINFIENYLKGRAFYTDIRSFFSCLDISVQMFLEHAKSSNPDYYTKTEIRRFWQYMGFPRIESATLASKATLRIKKGLIGGHDDRITKTEIQKLRQILKALSLRLEDFHQYAPLVNKLLDRNRLPRETLLTVAGKLVSNFIAFGADLSHIGINMDLNSLAHLPQDLRTFNLNIGLSHSWKNILNLTKQWKFIFSGPPADSIYSRQWPPLLYSVGSFLHIWLYYNRFLKNESWMHINSIQHTQYILSNTLDLLYASQKQFKRSSISLTDIDNLGESIWLSPFFASPNFKLGIRTIHCFILEPLSSNQSCPYHLEVKDRDVFIDFPDIKFHIDPNKKITFSYIKKSPAFLTTDHLSIIRTYLNSWIKSENDLRHANVIPDLLGSLNTWKNRNISVISGGHLNYFSNKNANKKYLMSQLNWQSHFMHIMSKSYTLRGTELDYNTWDLFIREWAPFAISMYKEITWETFRQEGLKFFANADMLTSHSNGDGIVQDNELLEVFSISFSALNSLLNSLNKFASCRSENPYYFNSRCILNEIKKHPSSFFFNFPVLLKTQFSSPDRSSSYLLPLDRYYSKYPRISIKDLMELFIMLHNQENVIEFLDKDHSQSINTREFFPLLSNFKDRLIEQIPFVSTDREAFAFMNYMLKFRKIPVFDSNTSINSPIHFAGWILDPKKWEQNYPREDLLSILVFLNSEFSLDFEQPAKPFDAF